MTDPLLAEIEAFLARSGMTPTAFGYEALRDPSFVFEMRKGRECRRATRERIIEWIRDHPDGVTTEHARQAS